MFLNISFDYYESFKLLDHGSRTWFSINFQNVMTIAAQGPSLITCLLSVFSAPKSDLTHRMRICLIFVEISILFTMTFIYVNIQNWIAGFFVLTIISIILLNIANGLFQNSMFGMASPFPFKYTNSIIIGQNFCGIAVTLFSMLTRAVSNDIQHRCILYFAISAFVIVVCIILLKIVKSNKFYQTFGNYAMQHNRNSDSESDRSSTKQELFKSVILKCWPQFVNIFLTFFVTLSIFPNVSIYVHPNRGNQKYSFFIPEKYFMDVTTFLNFNCFAFFGSLVASWIRFPGPKYVWIFVLLRFWFLFYFPASNYLPEERKFPVLFDSTWFFILNISLLALTSGYYSSLIMMYAPKNCHDCHSQRLAGMIAGFLLVFGIVSGLSFSWIIKLIVTY